MTPTPNTRRLQIVDANIAATHAYQVLLHRTNGKGDPTVWSGSGLDDAALQQLVARQQSLLATPPAVLAAWADGHPGAFDPARDLQPLLASPLRVTAATLPVNIMTGYLAGQPDVTLLRARALASLLQMMLDVNRDGDRLQELFALYVKLGLPVHTAQLGLPERTDEEFLALAEKLAPGFCAAPFDTDVKTVRMQFRKMWIWGRRHTGECDRRTVAHELLQEPDVQALLPRVRALPPQRIATIGHSFSMEVHWQSPSAFVPFVSEILARTNPAITVRQWTCGGLSLSRPQAQGFYQEALSWHPDRVLFVVAFYTDEDYTALERMAAGFRAAGITDVMIFDHLRATRHNTLYEESDTAMRAIAQRTGLRILPARRWLDASPSVDQFPTLDGIHMTEPYHRLMARAWLEALLEKGSATP